MVADPIKIMTGILAGFKYRNLKFEFGSSVMTSQDLSFQAGLWLEDIRRKLLDNPRFNEADLCEILSLAERRFMATEPKDAPTSTEFAAVCDNLLFRMYDLHAIELPARDECAAPLVAMVSVPAYPLKPKSASTDLKAFRQECAKIKRVRDEIIDGRRIELGLPASDSKKSLEIASKAVDEERL